jgi:hypothetical protein
MTVRTKENRFFEFVRKSQKEGKIITQQTVGRVKFAFLILKF